MGVCIALLLGWARDAAAVRCQDLDLPAGQCMNCDFGPGSCAVGDFPGTRHLTCNVPQPLTCIIDACTAGQTRFCTPCEDAGQHGTMTCGSNGTWGVCHPPAEICDDHLDNDCDGISDNGLDCGMRPVVFVPGMMGSRLVVGTDEYWPGCPTTDHQTLSQDPSFSHPNVESAGPALFAGSHCLGGIAQWAVEPQYQLFFDRISDHYAPGYGLLRDEVYPRVNGEFEFDSRHSVYTGAGCNIADFKDNPRPPRVFFWGWDWRNETAASSEKLRDFINGCVAKFWPGRQVDIIAHSHGGLVTRRYLLDFPQDHRIAHVATFDTPWLGAPKILYAVDTGIAISPWLMDPNETKELLRFFRGPHELVPVESYLNILGASTICNDPNQVLFSHTCSAFADRIDQGPVTDILPFGNYQDRVGFDLFGDPRPINPAVVSQAFHSRDGQDDWRNDTSGMKYLHIIGLQGGKHTPLRVVQNTTVDTHHRRIGDYRLEVGSGDGTVPIASQARVGGDFGLFGNYPSVAPWNSSAANINAPFPAHTGAPGAVLFPVRPTDFTPDSFWAHAYGSDSKGNDTVEHTKITGNTYALERIYSFFETDALPEWPITGPPPPQPSTTDVTIRGPSGVTPILMTSGPPKMVDAYAAAAFLRTSNLFSNADAIRLPNGDLRMFLDDTDNYIVRFTAGTDPITIVVRNQMSGAQAKTVTYRDLVLPAGETAQFSLGISGIGLLSRDIDGNGTFETVVDPTALVTGDQANDEVGPAVTLTRDPNVDNTYTISATDTSGVSAVLYSLDGGDTYTRVSGSHVTLCPAVPPSQILAMADDISGNRSSTNAVRLRDLPGLG